MLKKIYIKNGIIFVSDKDKYNMNINYNIINSSKTKIDDNVIKKYHEMNGCKYKSTH